MPLSSLGPLDFSPGLVREEESRKRRHPYPADVEPVGIQARPNGDIGRGGTPNGVAGDRAEEQVELGLAKVYFLAMRPGEHRRPGAMVRV